MKTFLALIHRVVRPVAACACLAVPLASQADEPFEYRVCRLVDKPFSAAVTYAGGGEGCSWTLPDSSGNTIEHETLQAIANRSMKPDELAAAADQMLLGYRRSVESGLGTIEPLPVCDGGWQLVMSADRGWLAPGRLGFYKCGANLVVLTSNGVQSTARFRPLAEGVRGLLK